MEEIQKISLRVFIVFIDVRLLQKTIAAYHVAHGNHRSPVGGACCVHPHDWLMAGVLRLHVQGW